MPITAPARLMLHPNYIVPKNIVTIAQPSGFEMALGGDGLDVQLSDIAKAVYLNRVDIRTGVVGQQATANLLPSAQITVEYAQTATYMLRTRNEYNEFDLADAAEYNIPLPRAYRLGGRQGIYQAIRAAALFGFNAGNNEGLLHVPNSTAINLPPDTYGNTTILTYDNGQLAIWFLQQIGAILERMYLLGVPVRVVMLAPQRIFVQLQLAGIVEVTSYQRPGAGTATIGQEIKKVSGDFDIEIDFAYDDTLIGAGSGSADAMIIVMPEAVTPKIPGINTNEFGANLQPMFDKMTVQFTNVAAPVEVITPIVEGVDMTMSQRVTSGWCPRGEALTVASLPYE